MNVQECIRLLVDAFAADVSAVDNAGRTAMATLVSRHKTHRPGVGAHAAKKLEIIESLAARAAAASDKDDAGSEGSEDDNKAPVRRAALSRSASHSSNSALLSPVRGMLVSQRALCCAVMVPKGVDIIMICLICLQRLPRPCVPAGRRLVFLALPLRPCESCVWQRLDMYARLLMQPTTSGIFCYGNPYVTRMFCSCSHRNASSGAPVRG